MSVIQYSELFYSLQGEGRYAGVPSIFLRTFGCNFRCKNFGRTGPIILDSNTKHNPEVSNIINNLNHYKHFKDLPLVATGCDSYSSVYPEFKRFAKKESTDQIAEDIINLLPNKQWGDVHLVITGGEPLLGWQRAYPDLLNHALMYGLTSITFETNGTQPLTPEFSAFLESWYWSGPEESYREVTFSVSPKLSCSGEKREDAIRPDIVTSYMYAGHVYLKFVIASEQDCDEALEVVELYKEAGWQGDVYLMPVGGVESVYHLNNRKVAELAMKHGLRYSDRLQVPLFKNAWNT